MALLSWGDHAAACSCAGPPREHLTLIIDSVTVDGVASSVDPYQGLALTVVASSPSEVSLRDPRRGSEGVTYAAY
ncbi:MAG: hypothetical protein Q8S73_25305 [Deltaproteobacteria bacterium]|nr:hypothetical protein [Deltaproteobacteria bacterium]